MLQQIIDIKVVIIFLQQKLEADSLEVKASKEQALQDLQQQRRLNTDLELRATELSKQVEVEKET